LIAAVLSAKSAAMHAGHFLISELAFRCPHRLHGFEYFRDFDFVFCIAKIDRSLVGAPLFFLQE